MNKQVKHILSFILLGVFLIYITPKEVYHAFTHHTDSTHEILNSKDGLQISNEHHHCELLKIDQSFSAFNIEIPFHDFNGKREFYSVLNWTLSKENYSSQYNSFQYLRGPPTMYSKLS